MSVFKQKGSQNWSWRFQQHRAVYRGTTGTSCREEAERVFAEKVAAIKIGTVTIDPLAPPASSGSRPRLAFTQLADQAPASTYEALIERASEGFNIKTLWGKPGYPTHRQTDAKRAVDPDFAERLRAAMGRRPGVRTTKQERDRALSAIKSGTRASDLRLHGLPDDQTLARHARSDPAFRRRYEQARSTYLLTRGFAEQGGGLLREALAQNALYANALKAIPAGVPPHVKDDVISEMIADNLAGELDLSEFKAAARHYLLDHHRNTDGGRYDHCSLDVLSFDDNTSTFNDTVTCDAEHF